jgi:hypothetical protein
MNWKNCATWILAIGLVLLTLLTTTRSVPAFVEREAAAGTFPRYSVVETEAHNLIVTDNATSKLYFYTIDKDKEVGSELKLRGTIDLKQVGKAAITPSKAKSE